VVRIW